jgi:hypothetical protein
MAARSLPIAPFGFSQQQAQIINQSRKAAHGQPSALVC